MRVLVLGSTGMLGHTILDRLGSEFEVAGTIRDQKSFSCHSFPSVRIYDGVHAGNLDAIDAVIGSMRPDIVINCIGIVKQIKSHPIESIAINALLPHQLAKLASARNARLIHFSTDCVFSGLRGNYSETDIPDPTDLYGRTKLLGEVDQPGALTLRISVIGHELHHHRGLLDWFRSQRHGRVSGYARALYSGLTTHAMADLLAFLLRSEPGIEGIWHVSGPAISKFDLLTIINDIYGTEVRIDRDESFVCDRRLDSTRFRNRTGWQPPTWREMIETMFEKRPDLPALNQK
jgi:dTDP-4-dehydrorhamnose reductase